MSTIKRLRDWLRGYSDADVESVRAKVQDHRGEFMDEVEVSSGELRALANMSARFCEP